MADGRRVARSGGGGDELVDAEYEADHHHHQNHHRQKQQQQQQQQGSTIFELSGESAAPRDGEDERHAEARVVKVDEPVLSNPWPFYLEDREKPASKWRVEGEEEPGLDRAEELGDGSRGTRRTGAKRGEGREGREGREGELVQANPWAYFGPLSRHDEGGEEQQQQQQKQQQKVKEEEEDVFSTMSGLEVALPQCGRRERGYSQGWRGREEQGPGGAYYYTPYSPTSDRAHGQTASPSPGRRESGDRRTSGAARMSYVPYRSPSPETAPPSEAGGGFDEILSESSPRTGREPALHHGPARPAALPGGEAACDPAYPPIPSPLSTYDQPSAQPLPRPQQQQQQQQQQQPAFHAETPSPTPFQTPASDQAHAVPVTPLSSVQGMPGPAGYYAPTPPAQPYETPQTQPMMPMPTPSPQPLIQAHPQPPLPPPPQQQHPMLYQPALIPGQSPPPPYIYYNTVGPGAQPLPPAALPAQYYYPPSQHPQPQPQPGWPPQPYPHLAQPAFAAARDDFVPGLPPRPPPVTVFAGQPAASWTGGHGPPGGMYAAPPATIPIAYAPQPPQAPAPAPSSSSSSPPKKLFSTATARRWLDKTSALLENKLDSVLQGSTGQWQPPRPVYQGQYAPPAQAPSGAQGYPGPQPYPYYGAPGQGGVPYQRYA